MGRFGNYPEQIRIYNQLFDALGDAELIGKVARENLVRIMPSRGIVLDPNYHYPETRYSRPLTRR